MTAQGLSVEQYHFNYTAVEFLTGGGVKLLGFCTEEPKEVLKKVFREYVVHKYKSLDYPITWSGETEERENVLRCGLIIGNTTSAPPGTKVVGSLDDLDLSIARMSRFYRMVYSKKSPDYRPALQKCLVDYFRGDMSNAHPLFKRARIEYETAMQEVAEVTLGITGMSFEELRRFLL